jgi:hypothetical protein
MAVAYALGGFGWFSVVIDLVEFRCFVEGVKGYDLCWVSF